LINPAPDFFSFYVAMISAFFTRRGGEGPGPQIPGRNQGTI